MSGLSQAGGGQFLAKQLTLSEPGGRLCPPGYYEYYCQRWGIGRQKKSHYLFNVVCGRPLRWIIPIIIVIWAPFLGDLSQSEKLSKIKTPLMMTL